MGVLLVEDTTGYLCREVVRLRGNGVARDMRRLTCPFSERRPCSIDCALCAAARDAGDRLLLVCRAGSRDVVLGQPDSERTDLDELVAMTAASDAMR